MNSGTQLVDDGEVVSPNMLSLPDVVAHMVAHGVREIAIRSGAEPTQVIGAIRILTNDSAFGDGGENEVDLLAEFGGTGESFVPHMPIAPPQPAASSLPSFGTEAVFDHFNLHDEAPGRQAASSLPSLGTGAALDDFKLHDEGPGRRPLHWPKLTVRESDEFERGADALYEQFAKADAEPSPAHMVARLKAVGKLRDLARTMDAIAGFMEGARWAKKASAAADMLQEVLSYEPRFADPGAKLIFSRIAHRIATPAFFEALVADLPAAGPRRAQYMAIFARFGDEAIHPLIERLAFADIAQERRMLLKTIIELRRGATMVMGMLKDQRWYVVRNAAEILGDMRATEAEAALIDSLGHTEQRVRRSATVALSKLGTPAALTALKAAMHDASPSVRMQATLAIATLRDPQMAPALIRALDEERDSDVQRTLLMALGKVGSPDAVRRLITAAEPEGRFFNKTPTAIRVAAVQALAEVRAAEARAALATLVKDREREVREAAARGLAAVANA
jgi:HEAT repeat protein